MWRKYDDRKYRDPKNFGRPKPSTNPENPNALDKLAAMVAQAEANYRERFRKPESNRCM